MNVQNIRLGLLWTLCHLCMIPNVQTTGDLFLSFLTFYLYFFHEKPVQHVKNHGQKYTNTFTAKFQEVPPYNDKLLNFADAMLPQKLYAGRQGCQRRYCLERIFITIVNFLHLIPDSLSNFVGRLLQWKNCRRSYENCSWLWLLQMAFRVSSGPLKFAVLEHIPALLMVVTCHWLRS